MKEIEFNCNHCGQHLVVASDFIEQGTRCPTCGLPVRVPGQTSISNGRNTGRASSSRFSVMPSFWTSVLLAIFWALIILGSGSWQIRRMFRKDLPTASLCIVGLFGLTWLVGILVTYFIGQHRLNSRLAVSCQIAVLLLFAMQTLCQPSFDDLGDVTTWMAVYAISLAGVVMVSVPLLLALPMLSASRGWLRLSLLAGVVLTCIQVIWIFINESAFLVNAPELGNFAKLLDPMSFLDGLDFLVLIVAEIILRASIAFALIFVIGTASMWVWRGFAKEIR